MNVWNEVDGYIEDLFVGRDDVLTATLADSTAGGLPPIAVAPNQGKLLMLLARLGHARSILEIGTLGGYSTIWLARGLEPDGSLITLELDQHHANVARKNLDRAGLGDRVEIRVGPALDSLEQLQREGAGPFDLVFIDADKNNYPVYLESALPLSRAGTLIIADNVVRNGAVADASSNDPLVVGVRRFNEMVARDPRLTGTIIQTVGSKGYDGLAFALVNDTGS
jgi:predicted O-methyltransferase YrrM